MAKIAFREVNVLHSFATHYREVYTRVYDELKDADENIHIGWVTNIDDPYDVEFHVGARDQDALHDFIVKHADLLSELSPRAAEVIRKQYLHEGSTCTPIPAPEGATPVDYKTSRQVTEGPERNSSWWYDCELQKVVTKREVLDDGTGYVTHKFVKVRD